MLNKLMFLKNQHHCAHCYQYQLGMNYQEMCFFWQVRWFDEEIEINEARLDEIIGWIILYTTSQ